MHCCAVRGETCCVPRQCVYCYNDTDVVLFVLLVVWWRHFCVLLCFVLVGGGEGGRDVRLCDCMWLHAHLCVAAVVVRRCGKFKPPCHHFREGGLFRAFATTAVGIVAIVFVVIVYGLPCIVVADVSNV